MSERFTVKRRDTHRWILVSVVARWLDVGLVELIEIAGRHGFPTITVRPLSFLAALEQGETERVAPAPFCMLACGSQWWTRSPRGCRECLRLSR